MLFMRAKRTFQITLSLHPSIRQVFIAKKISYSINVYLDGTLVASTESRFNLKGSLGQYFRHSQYFVSLDKNVLNKLSQTKWKHYSIAVK